MTSRATDSETGLQAEHHLAEKGHRPTMANNRKRIIDSALLLFNDFGYSSVTTNQIAEYISISPGNLYYHFRNKESIVDEIYNQMRREVEENGNFSDGHISPESIAAIYSNSLGTMWRFRFIFSDLADIARRNPSLAYEHSNLVRWAVGRLDTLFHLLRSDRHMTTIPDDEQLHRAAVNTAVVVTSWWRHLETTAELPNLPENHVHEGARHAFAVIEPHLEPAYATAIAVHFCGGHSTEVSS